MDKSRLFLYNDILIHNGNSKGYLMNFSANPSKKLEIINRILIEVRLFISEEKFRIGSSATHTGPKKSIIVTFGQVTDSKLI
jgi:hypothetical protein